MLGLVSCPDGRSDTRKNSLVNQVKFFGLAHAFATSYCNFATFKTFGQHPLKKRFG